MSGESRASPLETCLNTRSSPRGLDRRHFLLGAAASAASLAALAGCGDRGPDTRAEATGPGLPSIPPIDGRLEDLLAEGGPTAAPACEPLFPSVFLGGFEAASHLRDGRHLDLTSATGHDRFAELDYQRLVGMGLRGCRDGVSWPVCEPAPGRFDFSRAIAMGRAAQRAGVTVVWGLMHYGWPQDLDVYSIAFPSRFASYARAFLRAMVEEGLVGDRPIVAPVNEISFLAWAGGDVAMLNPHRREHSTDLKYQLVSAAIEAIHALREVLPGVRILHTDPVMNVVPRSRRPKEAEVAREVHLYQYQALDMMFGRTWGPQLGGSPDLVDVIGLNFYRNNQRYLDGELVDGADPAYKPLSRMLLDVHERYGKPMIVAETGAEDADRPRWLRYVSLESARAMIAGCPLHAVTLYPIVNHPGWADDRHIHCGLWDYPTDDGDRVRYEPLAREILAAAEPLTEIRDRYVLSRDACGAGAPA